MKRKLFSIWVAGYCVAAIAQSLGAEPSERELASVVGAFWKNFTEQQRTTYERCSAGQGGLDCVGVVNGPMQVELHAFNKVKCIVRADKRAHLCTFFPRVTVTSNNSMVADLMQMQLSKETSWSFARTGGALHLVAAE